MSTPCNAPLQEASLIDYWLDDLDLADAEQIEVHLFECSACSERLSAVAELIDVLQAMLRDAPPPIVSRSAVESMQKRGLRVQEEQFAPYGEAWARIREDVDICVVRIALDLQHVEALDLEYCTPDGTPFVTVRDVAFFRESHEVLLACERHVAAGHPAIRFKLTGISNGSRQTLADFTCIQADASVPKAEE